MRVVITGHKGQLGRQLQAAFAGHEIIGLDLPEADLTVPAAVALIAGLSPDLILHAAAFTNVDACEKDPDLAYRVNMQGTHHVALAAQRTGAPLLYISTNEVFDGSQRQAYREWDRPNPLSIYARTKAAGEEIVRALVPYFYIVRIAWLFGPGGNNFVGKILSVAREQGALRVAADEFGNPTYAPDLASAIARLVQTGHFGIYHLTNAGFCSRLDFAREIIRCRGLTVPITAILTAEWPRPSLPPLHSVLANTSGAALGITLRPWQEALEEYLKEAV